MKRLLTFYICVGLAIWLLFPITSVAQQTLRFEPWGAFKTKQTLNPNSLAIIKMDPKDALNINIAQQGFTVLQALANHHYLIQVTNAQSIKVPIMEAAIIEPLQKATPLLQEKLLMATEDIFEMAIAIHPTVENLMAVKQQILATGCTISNEDLLKQNVLEINGTPNQLRSVLNISAVVTATAASENVPLIKYVTANNGSFYLQNNALYGNILKGDSMTIGVGDSYSGIVHEDMKDRTLNFNPAPPHFHGVLTSSIAAGAGNINPSTRAIAPHARIISHWFNRVWAETPDMRSQYAMTLTNNSYASIVGNCSYAGTYDLYAQALDQLALDYPDVLHVFAAGNDGNLNCSPFPAYYATVTGGYQSSKNTISVGMLYKWLGIHNSSSKGPVKDGRLKPEIVSIGGQVFGDNLNNTYASNSGTSLSCPSVVGGLTLLSQRYKQLHGGAFPNTDVLKAILLVSATDIGRPGPDYYYGYGMMDLKHAMNVLESNQYKRDSVGQGVTKSFTITVPAGMTALKVMLAYNDLPGSPLLSKQLVNNLNVSVKDPTNAVFTPLILNPNPSKVIDTAVMGIDTLNNSEEVVINNPMPGTYTLEVTGAAVVNGTQAYAVAYDMVGTGIEFLFPTNNTSAPDNDSVRVYWESSEDTNTYTVEFSNNNGSSWTTLNNAWPAYKKVYSFWPAASNTDQCLVRVSRNNTAQVATTVPFIINTMPVVTLDAAQCPGFIKINWTAVPNVTGYEVWLKRGSELTYFASTNAALTTYTLGGLAPDTNYLVAVYPVFNGKRGFRSIAIFAQPNTGNCVGTFADGDLAITKILSPSNGRANTSTALTTSQAITLNIANNDDVAVNNYQLSYAINGGAWNTVTPANNLLPAASTPVVISGFNFSTPGDYHIKVAIKNLAMADPISANDTFEYNLRQLPNPLIDLTGSDYNDGFESNNNITLMGDTIGWDATTRWDYSRSQALGRLRTHVSDDCLITGNRSVSLDANISNTGTLNQIIGTFNLSNLNNPNIEARLSFNYRVHGTPKTLDSNKVWIRGSDVSPWVPVFNYDVNNNIGAVQSSGSISLSAALTSAAQTFSTSTQIKFGQNDTSVIAGADLGNGITLDDVHLYLVASDLALLNVNAPFKTNCAATTNEAVSIKIYNSVNQNISGATATYILDNGAPVTENLPTILAKDTLDYVFTSTANLSALGNHSIKFYINAPADTYHLNDSILNYSLRNQPLISSYPYLQNFENSDGYFYTEGIRSSWAYGTPSAPKISKAASGTKAWKTNLSGNYNDLETSYLYTPCFDITSLTAPMLSFSVALEIENCGASLCDQGFIEYTTNNGASWQKLGLAGQGTNWYNNTTFQAWADQNNSRWKVASIPLPVISGNIQFRFVLNSDPGASFEGMAIDDIHVYNLDKPIYDGATVSGINSIITNSAYSNAESGGKILAQFKSVTGSNNLSVTQYLHTALANPWNTQYFFPRSYVVLAATPLTDSVDVRLYILDADVITLINASGCTSCTKPADAYELGITKYTGSLATEDNLLTNNTAGITQYIPYNQIEWVPYDKGYYAHIRVGTFSELWFNDGGPNNSLPLPLDYVDFSARLEQERTVKLNWQAIIDTDIKAYKIERSADGHTFESLNQVSSKRLPVADYETYDYLPISQNNSWYYRLLWTMDNGKSFYSKVQKVELGHGNNMVTIYPNPVTNNEINLQWRAQIGTSMQYEVYDAIGKKVVSGKVVADSYNNNLKVTTEGWSKGVYNFKIIIGSQQTVKEVVLR